VTPRTAAVATAAIGLALRIAAGQAPMLNALAPSMYAQGPVTYSVMPAALVPVDTEHNKAKDFARTFCSALPHLKDKDGHAWGDCARYLESAEAAQPQTTLTTAYRFLLVSGFGADCLKEVRAFSTSIAHLKDAHQIAVEYFAVPPFGSSEENGKSVARHIDEAWTSDKGRRYVLIGYSKGAADLLEALRFLESPKNKVAALVTVAGTIGGIWRPEDVKVLMQPTQAWMSPGCPGNMQDGIHSLLREVRFASLRQNPTPVPGYSIVGATTLNETSTLLRGTWKRLSVYAKEQDGQVIAWEAVLPSAKYLGAARADHWGIALPFEESSNPPKAIDHNHFPRDALLESLVRYVSADLAASEAAPK
jgi:hypothetical protein